MLRPVALLVARVPAFERVAWRCGRAEAQRLERRTARAFRAAAMRIVRVDDALAHDAGADTFAVAMLGAPRDRDVPLPGDCRSAAERIALAVSQATGLTVESGWSVLSRFDPSNGLAPEIDRALERGAAERERYGFFAAIGHELRTPLTSIRGYLETVLDDEMDAATRHAFLHTARRETLRLGRLVDGMLDFSLLDLSGGAPPLTCDLCEAIAAACDAVAPQAAERSVTLIDRGGSRERVGLGIDACTQAILNLLDNAIKHGRAGGHVWVGVSRDGDFARVCVEDDGSGVAPDEIESVFAARTRGSNASGPGRGIGLAIVRTIVERAGGDVRVAASPLGGASFAVRLPIRDAARAGLGLRTS